MKYLAKYSRTGAILSFGDFCSMVEINESFDYRFEARHDLEAIRTAKRYLGIPEGALSVKDATGLTLSLDSIVRNDEVDLSGLSKFT